MNELDRDPWMTTADMANAPARISDDAPNIDHRKFMPPPQAQGAPDAQTMEALFPHDELNRLRSRWGEIQAEFVDEPRRSVEEADGLVASTIKQLAESFAEARSRLEGQWSRGGDVSTEDLRQALRHYRSFFERLLAI